jgi:hypothetical protein
MFGGASLASAIYPDSSNAYTDGVSGVTAIINGCTNDAVIAIGKSTRHVGFNFSDAVVTNSNAPAWTSSPFMTQPHLTIRNLLYQYNSAAYYQFTTQAAYGFPAPDGSSYQVQFVNPYAQASSVTGPNQPYLTSLIIVTHNPANPSTGAVENWIVQPDNTNMNPNGTPPATQVGVLLSSSLKPSLTTNDAEFSMAFQFTITRK